MDIVTDQEQLHKPTKSVEVGENITEVVDTLFSELKERAAVGLSASQFGYDRQIFVMEMKTGPPVCVVNPVVAKRKGSLTAKERCLSIPGIVVEVRRPSQIVLKGLNRYFKPVRYKLSGLCARTACHEVDHLNGILITDKVKEE